MSDLEQGGARREAVRGAVLWVVLVLAAGVLGMQALGTAHGGHGATGPAVTTSQATGHDAASSHLASSSGDEHEGATVAVVLSTAEAVYGCVAGARTMCLGVLSALVLLLLHRRAAGSLSVRSLVRTSVAPDRVVPGDWLPPPRLLLCVSRT